MKGYITARTNKVESDKRENMITAQDLGSFFKGLEGRIAALEEKLERMDPWLSYGIQAQEVYVNTLRNRIATLEDRYDEDIKYLESKIAALEKRLDDKKTHDECWEERYGPRTRE